MPAVVNICRPYHGGVSNDSCMIGPVDIIAADVGSFEVPVSYKHPMIVVMIIWSAET